MSFIKSSGIIVLAALSAAIASGQTMRAAEDRLRSAYILGPGDQIIIRGTNVDEIGETPFRIDDAGSISLPLLGKVAAQGLSVEQLEARLTEALKQYVRNPLVVVTVVQFRSEPVFFIGAFQKPGIYPLQGRHTIVEMLTSVGGLLPNASRRIRITRRKEMGEIPLPNVIENRDEKTSSVDISLGSLLQNVNPAEDIFLQPYDVITAERAEMIYVTGEVAKVGGIELAERESISVTQVITLAGGLTREADQTKIRVLRPVMSSSERAEIPLDLKKIFHGDANDFPLLPNDVLYIPRRSGAKNALKTVGLVAVPIVPTLLYVFR